jgi:hypothetical protein
MLSALPRALATNNGTGRIRRAEAEFVRRGGPPVAISSFIWDYKALR